MERKSNIELLRIIAAMMVVILHYIRFYLIGEESYFGGPNYYFLGILECFCDCAVNIFVLLSGYFLIDSDKRYIDKPLMLLLQVIIFRELGYVVTTVINDEKLTLYYIIGNFLPSNYFVILYLSVYFISPYINRLLRILSIQERNKMLFILGSIFVLWSFGADFIGTLVKPGNIIYGLNTISREGSQAGYTCVNFMLMYIIGAYIKLNDFKLSKINTYITLIFSILIVYIGFIFEHGRNIFYNIDANIVSLNYNSPFVIIMAVCVFLLFKNLDFSNKVVNKLSKAAFTCYLAQSSFFQYLGISYFVKEPLYILAIHLFLSVILIYIISYFLHIAYSYMVSPLFIKLKGRTISY